MIKIVQEIDIETKTYYKNITNLKIFNVGDIITFKYNETSEDGEQIQNTKIIDTSEDGEQIQNKKIINIFKNYINVDDEKTDRYQISYIYDIVSGDKKSLGGKRRIKKTAKKANKKPAKKNPKKQTAKKQKKSAKKTKRHR